MKAATVSFQPMAKTISAYDMTVSDTLYGPVKCYVSEERLKGMLDYEFTPIINSYKVS